MTKPKPRPARAADAVKEAIAKETAKRVREAAEAGASGIASGAFGQSEPPAGLKPIEIVKIALSAYLAYANGTSTATAAPVASAPVESADKAGLRRGTQAAVDRLLFNANYWLAAYEDRIVAACPHADAAELLEAVTVWGTHALKLNTLSADEAAAVFERFCPPFAANNRRGGSERKGKGPVVAFEQKAREAAERHPECAEALEQIIADMQAEAAAYEGLRAASALDALYAILPAWCLQDKIGLVACSCWEDADVMALLADELHARFAELGYGDAPCQYFHDSMREAIDAYQLDVTSAPTPLSSLPIADLLGIVHAAREAHPNFEVDGYGDALPAWLVAKEQLIWNTVVCAMYGPANARPLLTATPGLFGKQGRADAARTDVITDLAKSSFRRYASDRAESGDSRGYETFADQPVDLRNSSIEHIKSIPEKLAVLGYEIVPDGSCYPTQKILALSQSEVECLAILEHRRWMTERLKAGWTLGEKRDTDAKTSPYLVPWEELPDRAREWNRSAVRSIPALLAGENLAIARK